MIVSWLLCIFPKLIVYSISQKSPKHSTPVPLPAFLQCPVRSPAGVLAAPAVAPPAVSHSPSQSAAQWPKIPPPPSPPHSSSDASLASGSPLSTLLLLLLLLLLLHLGPQCTLHLAPVALQPRPGAQLHRPPALFPAHWESLSAGRPVWPDLPCDRPTGQVMHSRWSVLHGGDFHRFPGEAFV